MRRGMQVGGKLRDSWTCSQLARCASALYRLGHSGGLEFLITSGYGTSSGAISNTFCIGHSDLRSGILEGLEQNYIVSLDTTSFQS
jgi:hypothetical protein